MNNDQIIRLAQEAGLPTTIGWLDSIMRFAAAVAAVEREACAKVCDPEPSQPNEAYTVLNNKATMRRCAATIRTRGQK